ncbi:MAG: NifB/NifX family molybdenum-iron cluster-binding protein [Bacteroidota bacterium]
MKIAIPSNDQTTVSRHFGRTTGFMIFEIEGDKIITKEYKSNTFTGHSKGLHHEKEHNHSHSGIFNALGDCDTVIAGGMGRRLYDDFEQKGMNVFVTSESNIDQAVELFIKNELDNNSDKTCNH